MSGFVRETKIFHLTWPAGAELAGLEVRAATIPIGDYIEVVALAQGGGSNLKELVGRFAGALISWNLQKEDGTPVPATTEGLLGYDFQFVDTVIGAWLEAINGVAAPLEQPSSSGAPALEASLPMAPLSPGPVS